MKVGTTDNQTRWRRLHAEIPDMFVQAIGGRQAIAPADKWKKKHTAENGDLYLVFPIRGKPSPLAIRELAAGSWPAVFA